MLQSRLGCVLRSAGKLFCSEIYRTAQNAMVLLIAVMLKTPVAKLFTLTPTSRIAGQ